MTYTIGEKSLNFVADGEIYFCYHEDDRFEKLKSALLEGRDEQQVLNIYYKQILDDAKAILNGDKNWGQSN